MPANNIAKWNGSAWSALGSGMNGSCLCAGGERDQSLRRRRISPRRAGCRPTTLPNGTAAPGRPWAQGCERLRLALAVSGTNLYAGGYFTTAGGVAANNIAKWDGSAWSALGSGMDGAVYALAVSGTNLYAGG